jgi:hypothetical protein
MNGYIGRVVIPAYIAPPEEKREPWKSPLESFTNDGFGSTEHERHCYFARDGWRFIPSTIVYKLDSLSDDSSNQPISLVEPGEVTPDEACMVLAARGRIAGKSRANVSGHLEIDRVKLIFPDGT